VSRFANTSRGTRGDGSAKRNSRKPLARSRLSGSHPFSPSSLAPNLERPARMTTGRYAPSSTWASAAETPPRPAAVYKVPVSAPRVAQTQVAHATSATEATPTSHTADPAPGDYFETSPGERTQLRNQKAASPLRPVPRVLSGSAWGDMAPSLVSGHTAALGKAPLESGAGAKSGTPVINLCRSA